MELHPHNLRWSEYIALVLYEFLITRPIRPLSKIYAAVAIFWRNTGRDAWSRRSSVMLDAMFLAIGFGFLAGAVLYVVACDRL